MMDTNNQMMLMGGNNEISSYGELIYSSEELELKELPTKGIESMEIESFNFYVCDRFKPLWGDIHAYR